MAPIWDVPSLKLEEEAGAGEGKQQVSVSR